MFEHKKILELNDFFKDLSKRPSQEVYFYRVNGYSEEIAQFLFRYYETARKSGVIIEGKIPNPDEKNLSYYNEIMGIGFQMSMDFILISLKKWLPRMKDSQRKIVADSIYHTLDSLKKAGKNENMLKNAYIKFMCWLYYKFERIVNQLGEEKIPKILYEGDISNYELLLISILSGAGCDVILLQYHGDEKYQKLDAKSLLSDNLILSDMEKFPEQFHLKYIKEELQNQIKQEQFYGKKPEITNYTNVWIEGNVLESIKTRIDERQGDKKSFYNCYCRINGVENKVTYINEWYQFYLELKNQQRRMVIVDNFIPIPTVEEISKISRKNYEKQDQMLTDLSSQIQFSANIELQRLMVKTFIDVILFESKSSNHNLNKLTNKAVYLLCWLKRYQEQLFFQWKMPQIGCFILMGNCKNENEALFVKFLARLPINVLILNPNREDSCLKDTLLYEINYPKSLVVHQFPREDFEIQMATAAYHAERELDTFLYQDTGMYRNQQYAKANSIVLQTMYEEIPILWKEELKYRPNFSVFNDTVTLPVILAKVCGVKNGDISKYWAFIKELITEDTYVVKKVPLIEPTDENPMKAYTMEFLKNGRIQKTRIKEHPKYPYGFLREEMQDYILQKLQLLIDQKEIKGMFERGIEYLAVATILNLPKELLRLIQKFDFTKKNPKFLYIHTGEQMISLEDSILTAFLNLIGFDIVFFVPTGYQNVEKNFNKKLMEEHQIGEYQYDLRVPNFDMISSGLRSAWLDKILKRGR